jgi:predicted Zn-dependent protease
MIGVIVATSTAALAQTSGHVPAEVSGPDTGRPLTAAQIQIDLDSGHLDMEAASAYDAHDYKLAEADARQSMSLLPGGGIAEDVLALSLVAEGKDDEAGKLFADMYANNESDPEVMLPYALWLLKHGNGQQALKVYQRALPRVGDGEVLYGARMLEDESNYSPDSLDVSGLEMYIHIALGLTYNDGLSWGGHSTNYLALSEFSKAIAIDKDSDLANLGYASGLLTVGRRSEANAIFQKLAAESTGDEKVSATAALGKISRTMTNNAQRSQ